jgi:hypothetical protein
MRCALICLLLAGCATAPPPQTITIEKPVTVPGPTVYVPIPPALFDGCVPPTPAGPTNGDLLLHDHAAMVYATCLESKLAIIKGLH